MNVLLTCAGRRSFNLAIFKETVIGRGQVFACDSQADAAALQDADEAFVVPAVDDPAYVEALLALCDAHRIGLLIPALEPELPLLAEHRARFAALGTVVLVSSPEIVAMCYDKLEANRFLARQGLAVPPTFQTLTDARQALREGRMRFPLVVKPRWGVSSFAVAFAGDDEELELTYRLAHKQLAHSFLHAISASDAEHCVLIQEKFAGTEYGLDVVNDLAGRYVATFARKKIRMRAGQTDRAITVHEEKLTELGRRIGQSLGHVGVLDCDLFLAGGESYVIDLNPRIGGGYPFSHLAGANIPAALVAWTRGETPDPRWFQVEPGVAIARGETFIHTQRHNSMASELGLAGRNSINHTQYK